LLRQAEGVEGRYDEILGEGALAVDADAVAVAAQVAAAGAAVAAVAAGDVSLAGDPVADLEAAHLLADADHLADVLVAHHHGHRDGFAGPFVPVVDVHVGAADGGLADADEQVVVTDLGFWHLGEPDARLVAELGERLHDVTSCDRYRGAVGQTMPSRAPTRVKASIAAS